MALRGFEDAAGVAQNALSSNVSPKDSFVPSSPVSLVVGVSCPVVVFLGSLGGMDGSESSSGSSSHSWISSRDNWIGDTSEVVRSTVSGTLAGSRVSFGSRGGTVPGSLGDVSAEPSTSVRSELDSDD